MAGALARQLKEADGVALEFEALFVSGGAGSPQREFVHSDSSPVDSPAKGDGSFESPPASPPPRPAAATLSRVSSGVMDIPAAAAAAAADVGRAQLVGPSPVPASGTEPADSAHNSAPGESSPRQSRGNEVRKLGPSDFTILSLVGQGAFGKV